MIIVDTSAWVEYLRATGSAAHRAVRALIEDDREIGVPDVVMLELLAGAAPDQADELRRLLARFTALPASSPGDHELAATLYRTARAAGTTVRSLIDCMIAAAALRLGASVVTQDRDFAILAAVSDLKLEPSARES